MKLRLKEEIFKSDYVTIGELILFESYEDMLKQQYKYGVGNGFIKKPLSIENRFEILDL